MMSVHDKNKLYLFFNLTSSNKNQGRLEIGETTLADRLVVKSLWSFSFFFLFRQREGYTAIIKVNTLKTLQLFCSLSPFFLIKTICPIFVWMSRLPFAFKRLTGERREQMKTVQEVSGFDSIIASLKPELLFNSLFSGFNVILQPHPRQTLLESNLKLLKVFLPILKSF